MIPEPPHLTEEAAECERGEIRWILEHGIKMSGMPAFGPTHEDDVLRDVTAFVKTLPGITPERYEALTAGAGHGHGGGRVRWARERRARARRITLKESTHVV